MPDFSGSSGLSCEHRALRKTHNIGQFYSGSAPPATGCTAATGRRDRVGGAYVRHIRRIHDILKNKYNKRMMMWGDIILQHPDKLDQIPKDTVMLTWGYGARDSFEHQIIPFKESG